jgi:hypothetical protein
MASFSQKDFQQLILELEGASEEYEKPADGELLMRAAKAFRTFLSGTSLDEAFGQKRARGRPKAARPGKHFDLARRVFLMRHAGKSWNAICDAVGFEDPRELQRIYNRELPHILRSLSDELVMRLNSGISPRMPRAR